MPLDTHIPRGLTARIAGFHPAGPGSTPGVGNTFKEKYNCNIILRKSKKIAESKYALQAISYSSSPTL